MIEAETNDRYFADDILKWQAIMWTNHAPVYCVNRPRWAKFLWCLKIHQLPILILIQGNVLEIIDWNEFAIIIIVSETLATLYV